jgi:hypothetical protein
LDVTLADGSRERIDAEKVFVADASLMFSVAGHTRAAIGGVITARLASSDGNPAGAVRAKRP